MRHPRVAAAMLLACALLWTMFGCGEGGGNPRPHGLIVTSPASILELGESLQLTATFYTDDASTVVTPVAKWSSSNPSVAAVNAAGLLTAVGQGTAVIEATNAGSTGKLDVQVTPVQPKSLTITPRGVFLLAGNTQQYTAMMTYANGYQADVTSSLAWTISPSSTATVTQRGVVTGLSAGEYTVQGAYQGIVGQVKGEVTGAAPVAITVQPTSLQMAKGTASQLQVLATLSDGTSQDVTDAVSWTTSSGSTAAVNGAGVVEALSPGGAQLTASLTGSSHLSAAATLKVTSATLRSLAASPSSIRFAKQTTWPFHAIGTFSDGTTQDVSLSSSFASSNTAVAQVSGGGLATGIAGGTAQVMASFGGQQAAAELLVTNATVTAITVTPGSSLLARAAGEPLAAVGTFSDGSSQDLSWDAAWTSTDNAVATVNTTGGLVGVGAGACTVRAAFGGVSGAASIHVASSPLVALNVQPSDVHVAAGVSRQLKALGILANGVQLDLTNAVLWSSNSPNLATVDTNGLLTGLASGQAQIGATLQAALVGATGEGRRFTPQASSARPVLSSSANAVVDEPQLQSISIPQSSAVIAQNTSLPLLAVGIYSDGTRRLITNSVQWQSLAPAIATVNASGLATGVSPGTVQLNASFQGVTSASVSLRVTSATLTKLSVSGSLSKLAIGTIEQLTAIGTFSDGSTQDLTATSNWGTTDGSTATVASTGLLQGVGAGITQVQASFGGQSATLPITVSSATLQALTLSPVNPSLPLADRHPVDVTGSFSDGTTEDMSLSVLWSCSNPSVASLELVSPSQFVFTFVPGTSQLGAQFGAVSATTTLTVRNATLQSLTISPQSPVLPVGATQQFSATGNYSDGTTEDETGNVLWTESDPAIATIDAFGNSTAYAVGTDRITVESLGTTATTTLTVAAAPSSSGGSGGGGSTGSNNGSGTSAGKTLSAVYVTPTSARVAAGTHAALHALGVYNDGTREDLSSAATWSSSAPGVATVNSTGVSLGVAAGQATVSAQVGSVTGQSTLVVTNATLVSIALSPSSLTLASGTGAQLSAIGTFSDGSTEDLSGDVTWSSTSNAVAAVNSTGLVTAAGVGTAQISATLGGVSASTQSLGVTAATLTSLAISPQIAGLALGTGQQFSLIGTFSDGSTQDLSAVANWGSLTTAATISNTGVAFAWEPGAAQVSASFGGQTVSTAPFQVNSVTLTGLTITPTSGSIAQGTSQQFWAKGTFSDGSTQDLTANSAVWQSSAPAIATVGAGGLVLGGSAGSAQISASYGGLSASTSSFQVTGATLAGLTISPASASIAAGTAQQFTAVGTFSDGSTQNVTSQVTWSSSAQNVATVNGQGQAVGQAAGTASITASLGTRTSAPATLQVSPASYVSFSVSPTSATIVAGNTQQFKATATFSDGSTQDVTSQTQWQSTSSGVLGIGINTGLATGNSAGSATVTATYNGQSVQTSAIQVSAASLLSISVTPGAPSLNSGTTQQLTATGTYSDGSTQNISAQVNWSSGNPAVLGVSSSGLATAYATAASNPVRVTATEGGISASVTATVTPAAASGARTLTGVAVVPTSAQLAQSTGEQMSVRGTYSDGSTADLTAQANWTSSNGTVATVNASGFALGVAPGTATLTAQVNGVSGSTSLVITSATLVSAAVSPASASFAEGTSLGFQLLGTFSDGTTQDLSAQATWSSTAPSVVTVNTTGVAAGVAAGQAELSGSFGGQSYSTNPLTVSSARLLSLTINPSSVSLASGSTQQFTVTGRFDDGSTQDLTSQSSWTSSNAAALGVNSSGLATASGTGSATVTATFAGISASTGTVQATGATLQGITIAPNSASVPTGSTQQFTATGSYSDGSTQDLSSQVVWSSANPSALTINGSGLAEGGSTGSSTVTATFGSVSGTTTGAVQVTPATLVSITITPASASFARGTTQAFKASGLFTDGSTKDLTNTATWGVSDGSVAKIDASGLATAIGVGSAQITASSMGVVGTSGTVQVTPATFVSLAVSPSSASVPVSGTEQFAAIATFSDNSTQDVTASTTWSSSAPQTASVSSSGLAKGSEPGTAQINAVYGGANASASLNVTAATLQSITVTPSSAGASIAHGMMAEWRGARAFKAFLNPLDTPAATSTSIPNGYDLQYTATGNYSDGTSQDLTDSVVWSSSNTGIAAITQTGLAEAVSPGSTTITAAQGSISGAATLAVTAATLQSVAVTPTSVSLALGTTQQFHLQGSYSDGTTQDLTTQATWSSGTPQLLSVTSGGLVTSLGLGNATVSASYGGLSSSASAAVTPATLVSLALSPSSAAIALGSSQQFQAIGTFSDGTLQVLSSTVTWNTSAPSVVAVSSTGLATSLGVGTATLSITAAVGGQTATGTLVVNPATLVSLALLPSTAAIPLGTTQQFTLTGTYSDGSTQNLTSQATWQSTNPLVVTTNASGLATSTGVGFAQVSASFGGQSAVTGSLQVTPATLLSLSVSPTSASFAAGTTAQFHATGNYSDGSTQDLTNLVVWTSSNPAAATVSESGQALGVGVGATQISASYQGQTASTSPLAVTSATLTSIAISPTHPSIAKGTTQQFAATGTFSDGSTQDLTSAASWSSSNAAVATVSATGAATGLGVGSAQISASYQAQTAPPVTLGVSTATLQSLTISPAQASLADGTTLQLTATGTFSDGSIQDLTAMVNWTTTGQALSILPSGQLTGVAVGSGSVSASYQGVSAAGISVTVSPATLVSVSISPANASLVLGGSQQFTLTGTYSDGSTQPLTSGVTWTSSNTGILTVSGSGLVTTVGVGTASVYATYNGQSATPVTLSVGAATLQSLAVTGAGSLAVGLSEQLTATGSYSDGSTQNLSSQVSWSVSPAGVASVSSSGVVTVNSTGAATITAQLGGVSTTFTLSGQGATPVSIAVTPTSASLALGTAQQFHVFATLSDGSIEDVTSQAVWSSSAPGVASVSQAGAATTTGTGTTNIGGSYGGLQATAQLAVTPATLRSVAITPSTASIAAGTAEQFHLIGTYSDGTTEDVSSLATWTTGNSSVATVAAGGLATGTGVGATSVSASFGGQTASTQSFAVTNATLTSLAISPATSSIALGTTGQLSALGTYSDGSTEDLSKVASWSSSDGTVASVSTTGLATSVAPGSVTITASFGGQSATTSSFVVTPATLSSLSVSPSSSNIAVGTNGQFQAVGTYSDGSTQHVSADVVWSSANPAFATINEAGVATGVGIGATTITATLEGVSASTQSFSVTNAVLTGIALSPTSASLAQGTTEQFTATGSFSDGSTENLTPQVSWQSGNGAVVSVTSAGLANAIGIGSTTVVASYGGQTSAPANVSVTAAVLQGISISPGGASIPAGTTQQYTATGTFSDSSTQNLTNAVVWQSSTPADATLSATGLATGLAPGGSSITASYQGIVSPAASLTVTSAALTGIVIAPASASIANGTTQQYTATGLYTDGSTQNLTSQVSWSSATPTTAMINGSGLATGKGLGTSQITATLGGTTATPAVLTVTAATMVSLAVTPGSASAAAGTRQQFAATATYTDGTTQDLSASASWVSSNPAVATINGAGLAYARSIGAAQITAAANGTTSPAATLNVSPATIVSLALTPATLTVAKGSTLPLQMIATFSDGTTQNVTASVLWTSTNVSVVTVNGSQLAVGLSPGNASITGTYLGVVSNSIAVTVTPATLQSLTVTPSASVIASGFTVQLRATGLLSDGTTQDETSVAVWSSTNNSASVNASGLVTGASVGTATINAQVGAVSGSATVTVGAASIVGLTISPANATVPAGNSLQYTATATYSDGTSALLSSQVVWSLQAANAGTLSSTGLFSAKSAGSYTVQASANGLQASANGTVGAPLLVALNITPSAPSIAKGTAQQLVLTGTFSDGSTQNLSANAVWQSSLPSIATVNANGLVTGTGAGITQISASYGGQSTLVVLTVSPATLVSIALSPASASIASGTGQQFTAVGTLSDASTQDLTTAVAWSSGNPSTATINSAGLATAVGVGTTTVRAQSGSVSAQVNLTVTQAVANKITITPSQVSLAAGDQTQLMATATFTDGTSQNVTSTATYTSSNPAVLTVNRSGLVQALVPGTAYVTATTGSVSTSVTVTVTTAVLSSIEITPVTVSLAAGTSQQLVATGLFSDGSQSLLGAAVTWSSSAPATASVSATGNVTAAAQGTATVTATDGLVTATVQITVTPALVSAIAVSPAVATVAAGQTQQFTAMATMSDNSQQTVTSSAHWSVVSAGGVATVSNSAGSQGLATSSGAGTATVTATLNGISGSAQLLVTQATLVGVSVTPTAPSLPLGTTQQLTATGNYSDGSSANLSGGVQWLSLNPAVATVNSSGLVTATGVGTATLSATSGVFSGTVTVTVTAAVLQSLALSPAAPSLAAGLQQQLTAVGTYSNGSTATLTSQVYWTSSNTAVATVTSTGLAKAASPGTATITATLNGVSQVLTLNVTSAVLQQITVGAGAGSFPLGLSLQLSATGTYSDGSTQTLTNLVTWSSGTPSVGVVSAAGLATALKTGSFAAQATYQGVSGSVTVSVTSAVLQSITISPANAIILNVLGSVTQYSATGHFSDGTAQTLTGTHWSLASGLTVGRITDAGAFSPLGLGLGTIAVTYNGMTATTGFTVVSVTGQVLLPSLPWSAPANLWSIPELANWAGF